MIFLYKIYLLLILIYPKFKEIIEITAKSVYHILNKNDKKYCFELFGYDFIMDEELNVYLLEINTNPGLEISSDLIKILVPRMINDCLKLTVDILFNNEYKENKYFSKYHVSGYEDKENLWEFICDISNKQYKNSNLSPVNNKKKYNKKHKKNRSK